MLTGSLSLYIYLHSTRFQAKEEKKPKPQQQQQQKKTELHSATSQTRTTIYSLQSKLMITKKNEEKHFTWRTTAIYEMVCPMCSLRLRVFFLPLLQFLCSGKFRLFFFCYFQTCCFCLAPYAMANRKPPHKHHSLVMDFDCSTQIFVSVVTSECSNNSCPMCVF